MARSSGLSLLELVTTLCTASLLTAMSVPSFLNLVQDSRRAALVNSFIADLQLARSESLLRPHEVTLCRSASGQDCSHEALPWNLGWLVFVNADGDSPPRVDPGEPVLRVHESVAAQHAVFANRPSFSFRNAGLSSINGTIEFCDARGPAKARAIIISRTGRARSSPRRADGTLLHCQ